MAMAKNHVKKDDVVTVISGVHIGKTGKVLKVDRKKQRIVVENVNVGRKTVRRSPTNQQGGLIEVERSIHISNVMLEAKYEARRAKRGASPAKAADAEAEA